MDRLKNKVALITGAGSGFGREAALLFAREGASVAVADIDEAGGSDTASQIASLGGRAIFIRSDVSRPTEIKAMVDETVRSFGRINILYNNAGVPMPATPVTSVSEELYAHVMDVNLKGVLFGCRYGAAEIAKNPDGGSIINTASLSALKGRPNLSIYAASKGAVVALTKSLAIELAPKKIRVNSICPVAADTPMLAKFMPEGGRAQIEAMKKAAAEPIPMKRLGRTTDTANLALFLASDESEFITGLNIPVDGGYSA
jgi:NAD(P)-dependent dehydrogenase (short-subunit alcohol dehydrogenase family)